MVGALNFFVRVSKTVLSSLAHSLCGVPDFCKLITCLSHFAGVTGRCLVLFKQMKPLTECNLVYFLNTSLFSSVAVQLSTRFFVSDDSS